VELSTTLQKTTYVKITEMQMRVENWELDELKEVQVQSVCNKRARPRSLLESNVMIASLSVLTRCHVLIVDVQLWNFNPVSLKTTGYAVRLWTAPCLL
jgi:hypothetical protein